MIDELEASRGEDEGVNASIGVETVGVMKVNVCNKFSQED